MKKIIKSICFSLLAFMFAIGSIFLPVGKHSQKYASADVTTSTGLQFLSNDVIFARIGTTGSQTSANSFDVYVGSDGRSFDFWFNFQFRLRQDNDNPRIIYFDVKTVNNNPYPSLGGSAGTWYTLGSLYYNLARDTQTGQDGVEYFSNSAFSQNIFLDSGTGYNGFTRFAFSLTGGNYDFTNPSSTSPTLIMKSLEIGNYSDFNNGAFNTSPILNTTYAFTYCNIVSYVDTNDYRYTFYIPNWSTATGSEFAKSNYYNYRKYFMATPQLDNQEAYNQGFIDGNAQGFDTGYNDGYREGSSVGYDNGFENGKIEGAIESNNYSFFGLISAIIDAPVKILTSLFNFEFLGVNLWAFFTSILTISLVIFVIRKFMAKG